MFKFYLYRMTPDKYRMVRAAAVKDTLFLIGRAPGGINTYMLDQPKPGLKEHWVKN